MDNTTKLKLIEEKIKTCNKCQEMIKENPAAGDGFPEAKIVFIGEAEGRSESEQGKVFIGQAGKLLTSILDACEIKREDIFITNICKCRPPNNRMPLPEEASNCRPFLDLQLDVIKPKFIICLGSCATKNLLGMDAPIGTLRGQWFEYRGMKVMPSWHPSYGLRQKKAKYEIYLDVMMVVKELQIPIEQPPKPNIPL